MPTNQEKLKLFSLKIRNFKGPDYVLEQYLNELEAFSHSDIERISQIIMKRCILEGKKLYTKKDIELAVKKQKSIVALRKTQY